MDIYAKALKGTLTDIPYNSATHYHEYFGDGPADPRFGAACIMQTIDVARRAVDLGAPEPVLLQDMRHVGAVFHDNGDVIVLDPYLLHREPIRFSAEAVESGEATVEVPAAPVRRDSTGARRDGRLHARYKKNRNGYVIRLDYFKFSPSQDKYVLSRHFSLRENELFDMREFTADIHGLMTHPEQTSVSIRAVLPGLQRTAEAIIPLKGFAERVFTADDIWLRTGEGVVSRNSDPGSSAVWEELEGSLSLPRADIADHLVSAAEIYQRIADPKQELAPYALVE
ncbi:hypothetical protein GCM10010116_56330 [Microbispora rosea subsp. aerata]|nr:hypothetical protein [Microbispora rosea]GGO28097.1 hypothetical protein GCM10010116_56330 [Microbispora rosea subsp. aerata]GIH56180.1 hypothetical protein Mro02_30940 [Microbispora rosea subsp. aerata]GLJ85745.1 hypothetical protein GCM10017588_44780 [Microbispora rosea subsp. aerata]